MVVCVCNAIREKDLRACVRSGAHNACAAYASLGRKSRCGECLPFAQSIVRAELAAA